MQDRTIIGIIEKSPHPQGRIGRKERQDWWQQCLKAREYTRHPRTVFWVVSATKAGEADYSAAHYYAEAGRTLGFPILTMEQGYETIGQIRRLKNLSFENNCQLILIATWTHAARVHWICKREKVEAEIVVVGGIPRPKEWVTDLVLDVLYPLMDRMRILESFLAWVERRRKRGKL